MTLGLPGLTCAPTTLALASISIGGASEGSVNEGSVYEGSVHEGSAEYRFYLTGTSAADVEYSELAAAVPVGVAAVYVGDLALLIERLRH